jgi:hypothetical protein
MSRPFLSELEENISQMVQGPPKLKRIDQGLALSVFAAQPLQVLSLDPEGGYPFCAVLDPDAAQGTPSGKKKRSDEDVRRLYALSHVITSFPKPLKNLSRENTRNLPRF